MAKDTEVKIRNNIFLLEKGFYIYAGSAFGAGGLSSRIHRHLRRDKKQHWHIDQTTSSSNSIIHGVAVFPNEKTECQISEILGRINGISSIIGFGNSDCKNQCSSHFFRA